MAPEDTRVDAGSANLGIQGDRCRRQQLELPHFHTCCAQNVASLLSPALLLSSPQQIGNYEIEGF